jgi:hypothetical protein
MFEREAAGQEAKSMTRRTVSGCVVMLAMLAGSVGSLDAADECSADIRGSLKRKEGKDTATVYTAQIDVNVDAKCASVDFDLVVVEDLGGGEQEEARVSKHIRIRDRVTGTMKLDYKLKRGRTIASHRLEQTGCELCE